MDHPEYISFIEFGDNTKLSPSYAAEPANYPTNLSAQDDENSMNITWTDALPGSQVPAGYLLLAYDCDNYFIPIDGETYSDDTDLSDGTAILNLSYSGSDAYTFNNIDLGNTYYITVYSYNGSGSERNYKINQTVPRTSIIIPLPVELIGFNAFVKKENIELAWRTITEVNNFGFEIERTFNNSGWEKIGFVHSHGNSSSPKDYTFLDNCLKESGKYSYRLLQIDNDGSYEYSPEVEISFGGALRFNLYQNYPNPFNPETTIKYEITEQSHISIKIYDILGNEIQELINEEKSPGIYDVKFNAVSLPNGVYIYKLQSTKSTVLKKMTILK